MKKMRAIPIKSKDAFQSRLCDTYVKVLPLCSHMYSKEGRGKILKAGVRALHVLRVRLKKKKMGTRKNLD